MQSPEGAARAAQLWAHVATFHTALGQRPAAIPSAIIPLILGEETKAVAAATTLRAKGLFVPAIRYPTVARGAARLRVTLTAAHSPNDVSELTQTLKVLNLELRTLA